MTLTDTQRFWVMLRDAGPQGIHSHDVRRLGCSGNPSQRAKDCVDKGQPVYTARENIGKRPGSRFWLGPHQPDWAIAVKGNGVEVGGGVVHEAANRAPAADLSADTLCWRRDYTDPDNDWALVPFAEVMAA